MSSLEQQLQAFNVDNERLRAENISLKRKLALLLSEVRICSPACELWVKETGQCYVCNNFVRCQLILAILSFFVIGNDLCIDILKQAGRTITAWSYGFVEYEVCIFMCIYVKI